MRKNCKTSLGSYLKINGVFPIKGLHKNDNKKLKKGNSREISKLSYEIKCP